MSGSDPAFWLCRFDGCHEGGGIGDPADAARAHVPLTALRQITDAICREGHVLALICEAPTQSRKAGPLTEFEIFPAERAPR